MNIHTGTVQYGECWVTVAKSLSDPSQFPITYVLAQGYATKTIAPSYPGTIQRDPQTGQGAVFTSIVADPAPGASATFTIPAGVILDTQSIGLQFLTDATATTRYVYLIFTDGANIIGRAANTQVQPASTTRQYSFTNQGSITNLMDYALCTPFAPPLMSAGYKITISVFNSQPTDQLSKIYVSGRSWMSGV